MMDSQTLLFAQRYPFSETSRKIVKELNISPESIPDSIVQRALFMISKAAASEQYLLQGTSHSEVLEEEVLAFPVAKILVSATGHERLYRQFASMISDSSFSYLESEKNRQDTALRLAKELGISFEFSESPFFASMEISDFLKISFRSDFLKLVNKPVKQGRVFLDVNDFCRFISEHVFVLILSSLPVPTKSIPKQLADRAPSVSRHVTAIRKKKFENSFSGKLSPDAFPPCMAELYTKLLNGSPLPHYARYHISSFLAAVGMQSEQIVELFKKQANFDERTTRYQVERIAGVKGKKYNAASCRTLQDHNVCTAKCPVKHPLQFYRRELDLQKKQEKKSS